MRKNKSSGSVKAKKAPPDRKKSPKPFPIVGIGASAGGLEAFTTFLRAIDSNLGMAYVLVMHLSPKHKSALAEVVQSKTRMTVQTVKNGMEVMMNNIYVIPPNTFMSVVDGHLKLAPRSLTSIGNYSVDYFLTALASVYKNNAIGIVLSGTGTDGTLGLKAIKAEGGITFAQDETAKFSGMPDNAYDAGYVDFRLPPEAIAKNLAHLIRLPYAILPHAKVQANQVKDAEELKKILSIVRSKTGIDFHAHYKQASIYRRVIRRMTLNKFKNLEDYCLMLRSDPNEANELHDDFLISVTHFFRDPDFFKILTKEVFPALIKQARPIVPIRIWVAGCATGEEAYSIAISLVEFLEKRNLAIPIQIFASDLDVRAIERARLGLYPASALLKISQNHLKKFFNKIDDHYQIIKSIREICIFSKHNILKDPPFSRMSLISCQNLLIYLETNPQKKVLQSFHYALKPSGYLFLGRSETIGTSTDLFEPLDKKIKLYSRKSTKLPQLDFTIQTRGSGSPKEDQLTEQPDGVDIAKDISKLMLSHYVHPGIVVNKNMMIVQFFGITSPYLEPITGKASLNILRIVRDDLVVNLKSLLQESQKTEKIVSKEGIRFYNKRILQEITIEVVPKKMAGGLFFLIVFKDNGVVKPPVKDDGGKSNGSTAHKKTIARLEEELVHSSGLIRTSNEEYETTYEELQANNEEIASANEELQSVNEELEASTEELQSSNEELTTTNEELAKRNNELNESQRELKKVNEQLEQFAFISSHDLQEPLRKIETFADFLAGPEANLNDYAKKYSSKIGTSALRMSTLIKDLLTFSVLTRKEKKFNKVNLNETLKNIIEDFEVIIAREKAIVNSSSLPVIYGEPVQMNQLFHNLLSNALKFSKRNPIIDISSREVTALDFATHPELMKDKAYVAISVKDNGIGFNQKYTAKMFMLFQRLHDSKVTEGTGVGLAICKKIVEDHNGLIFADGIPNGGATFTVFLPAE